MIEIRGLCKSFGKLKVLQNIDLHCQNGQSIALIGPNGCGKTTLIKSILSMVIPDKGEILFAGQNIKGDYKYRSAIGYMPQIGRYPDNMNVGNVIETMQQLREVDTADLDQDLYNAYKLQDILHKRMATLSGGTRQKVSASIAFMFNPKVLILDEPTAGLDPLASDILKEKINIEKKKGKLVLITSHLLSELDELVSELIFMQDGKVIFHKNTDQLKSDMNEKTISKAISNVLRAQNTP